MKKSYEFSSVEGSCFILDLSIYTGLTYRVSTSWVNHSTNGYFLYFHYFKKYSDDDGFISVDKDYDVFEFSTEEQALKVFNDVKELLKELKK